MRVVVVFNATRPGLTVGAICRRGALPVDPPGGTTTAMMALCIRTLALSQQVGQLPTPKTFDGTAFQNLLDQMLMNLMPNV
ncbi:MAG: hypothetical protein EXQ85_10420 [Alphaproteobacteria bacterium]|nr:hypothetical protein [Alphaproteobacteria bacterium]